MTSQKESTFNPQVPYLCACSVLDDISLQDMLPIPLELNVILDAVKKGSNVEF